MNTITKWGFGSAPFKKETARKYLNAISIVADFISQRRDIPNEELCDALSEVKGLFNRILRQDQWDWFTVNMYFDYPRSRECRIYVNMLTQLRKALNNDATKEINTLLAQLKHSNIEKYLENFNSFSFSSADSDEYIYILSRREEKNLLKIGMTTRNVIKRCQEINSATGVLYPLSPRAAYRVLDAQKAEHVVHSALSEYRVRIDREFFILEYKNACDIIERVLKEEGLLFYK